MLVFWLVNKSLPQQIINNLIIGFSKYVANNSQQSPRIPARPCNHSTDLHTRQAVASNLKQVSYKQFIYISIICNYLVESARAETQTSVADDGDRFFYFSGSTLNYAGAGNGFPFNNSFRSVASNNIHDNTIYRLIMLCDYIITYIHLCEYL